MEPVKDFKELLGLFAEHRVDFMIVGAFALAYHGAPRFTGDLDVLVKPDEKNAERILAALDTFGFASLDITIEDLSGEDNVIQLGHPPVRVDLLTSISGITWEEANATAESADYGGVPVRYLGRSALIKNKKATGRAKDLLDLDALGE